MQLAFVAPVAIGRQLSHVLFIIPFFCLPFTNLGISLPTPSPKVNSALITARNMEKKSLQNYLYNDYNLNSVALTI